MLSYLQRVEVTLRNPDAEGHRIADVVRVAWIAWELVRAGCRHSLVVLISDDDRVTLRGAYAVPSGIQASGERLLR